MSSILIVLIVLGALIFGVILLMLSIYVRKIAKSSKKLLREAEKQTTYLELIEHRLIDVNSILGSIEENLS